MPPTPGSAAGEDEAPQGGVEMAAAMAAKINAMLMAKGKLKPLEPLPSKVSIPQLFVCVALSVVFCVWCNAMPLTCNLSLFFFAQTAPTAPVSSTTEEVVVTEVDINDVPINCRNLLTKGKTQEEVDVI